MHRSFLKSKIVAVFGLLITVFLVSIFGFMVHVKKADAAIAKYLNFQTKLTKNSDGTNVADGTYSMQFKIYDAPSGGNLLWTETWDGTAGTSQVQVTNGVASVKLGTYSSLSSVDFTGGALYLTLNFNPGTGYDGEMSPRKQLLAAAFAFNANSVVGDGRIAITTTSTTQSAMQVTYNPDSSTSTPAAIISASSNVTGPALKVVQNGSGSAALFSGGNVGIGSTSPAALLTIQGTSGSAADLFNVTSSTNASLFKVSSNGSTTISSLTSGVVQSTSAGALYVAPVVLSSQVSGVLSAANGGTGTSTSPTVQGQLLMADSTGTKYTPGNLVAGANITINTTTPGQITISGSAGGSNYFTQNGSALFNNLGYELGVNSSTPTSNLVVEGSSTNPTLPIFTIASSSNVSYMTVTSAGNVGVGTATPSQLLSVYGNLFVATSSVPTLYVNTATRMIGVGTTTEDDTLAIQGATGTNLFELYDSTGTSKFFVNGSGQVGIGTGNFSGAFSANTIMALRSNTNNFAESNIQNQSNGSVASSDYVLTADNGSSSNYYTDLFQNSSGFINTGGISGGAGDSGLFNSDNSLYLETGSSTNSSANIYLVAQNLNIATGTASGFTFKNATTTTLSLTGLTGQSCLGTSASGLLQAGFCGGGSNYWTSLANGIFNNSGYLVGINSTTPTANLVVEGSSTNPTLPIFVIASSSYADYLVVGANGTIGIGSSTPSAMLALQGNSGSNTDLLNVTSSTKSSLFVVKSNGNVGIGTSSPYGVLDVVGMDGPSGATPNSQVRQLVVDDNWDGGISILSPANKTGNIFFANPTTGLGGNSGYITYDHSVSALSWYKRNSACVY